jgi:hypothetical protein
VLRPFTKKSPQMKSPAWGRGANLSAPQRGWGRGDEALSDHPKGRARRKLYVGVLARLVCPFHCSVCAKCNTCESNKSPKLVALTDWWQFRTASSLVLLSGGTLRPQMFLRLMRPRHNGALDHFLSFWRPLTEPSGVDRVISYKGCVRAGVGPVAG